MNALLDLLKSPDRSTRWGAIAGFALLAVIWLTEQAFLACCGYTLPIAPWVTQLAPYSVAMAVQHFVRDEYKPGVPAYTATERAELEAQGRLAATEPPPTT